MRARLQRYLFTGLLVVMPLAVTYLVLRWLFTTLDNILQPLLAPFFGHIPGLGVATGVAVILVAGAVASRTIGQRLIGFLEGVLLRVPVARKIYGTAKQLSDRILRADENGARGAFKRVVLVEWPRPGLYALGFVTGGTAEGGPAELLHVFIPGSPNPTAGFTVITTPQEVQPLNLTVEEALQFVIAYGIAPTPAATSRLLAASATRPLVERVP
ncbi:MAG: DUF502 domain-containing protein [Armatimonadota bacterium]|nr:DUF502 domain-containing protein [Armatimonadota bacterium]MDR7426800.1 DUF502 domain-containing protein [Armatimonadota bacterium]MDR7463937.1 DUF502 domain-containing protein [Armatimonadota bacterium]MDR7469890.1 DUF502 domain-containing protein [Armatimonadota bacterium]MDR7474350.1 DUF502 domain-containing protein [Armatimonadota bacterium]